APRDEESSGRIGTRYRHRLRADSRDVDLEVVADRFGAELESPCEHAGAVTVLKVASPDDQKAALRIDRDARAPLAIVGVGVHLELVAARLAATVEAPADDT